MKEMVGGCCVCSDERGWPENPLVYCDGQNCTVAVHQACYGIVTVPTGPWYCRKCESQERPARVRCELCPSRDGALKRTDNQGWAHVVCALYIPEVRFGNVTTMEPIILQLIPSERYTKTCYICQEIGKPNRANVGACMQCNKFNCKQQFHVTCAQSLGLLCEEAGNYLDNVKYCGYCQHHYSKLKKGGNVKTIPPYKPITHDSSGSDSCSSPEKEIDSTVSATASSTSATSIKITNAVVSLAGSTSGPIGLPSTKLRKFSTTSKQPSLSSSSSSAVSSAGTNNFSNLASIVPSTSDPNSLVGLPSNTENVSISGCNSGGTTFNASGSKSNNNNSGSSKEKEKQSKHISKINSNKDKDKELSSFSASLSSREKGGKSKTKDIGEHSVGGGGVAVETSGGSAQNLTSHATKQGTGIDTSLNAPDNYLPDSDLLPTTMSMKSTFGSVAKKRKADSKSGIYGDTMDINHSFRDIIKDVSVTLKPLAMDKTSDLGELEKISKKQKTETPPSNQSTIYQSTEPTIPNVSPKHVPSTRNPSHSTGNILQAPIVTTTESAISSSTTTSSSSAANYKTPKEVDERLRSSSPYNITASGVGGTAVTAGSTTTSGAPSLYVSVPLSTANVPGLNLPTINTVTTPDHPTPPHSTRAATHQQQLQAGTAVIELQSPRIQNQTKSSPAVSEHANFSSSLPSPAHNAIHQTGKSPSQSVIGGSLTATTTESGNLKISFEKQNSRVVQLQEQESALVRRSRTPDSGIFSSSFNISGSSQNSLSGVNPPVNGGLKFSYEMQSGLALASVPPSIDVNHTNNAALKDSPPSSPCSEPGSARKRDKKSNELKDVKVFQNGGNAVSTPVTTPTLGSLSNGPIHATHMLGNQLNPASSVAQKLTDQLHIEMQDHSVYTELQPPQFVGVPFSSKPVNNVRTPTNMPSSANSLASMFGGNGGGYAPQSLEQLLERQWEQGSQFLMEQAQHFDIASLLSCLHQLQTENVRLEEHVNSLIARRDHLLAVNARLAIPLNANVPQVNLNNIQLNGPSSSDVPVATGAQSASYMPPANSANVQGTTSNPTLSGRTSRSSAPNSSQLPAIENGSDCRHSGQQDPVLAPAVVPASALVQTGSNCSLSNHQHHQQQQHLQHQQNQQQQHHQQQQQEQSAQQNVLSSSTSNVSSMMVSGSRQTQLQAQPLPPQSQHPHPQAHHSQHHSHHSQQQQLQTHHHTQHQSSSLVQQHSQHHHHHSTTGPAQTHHMLQHPTSHHQMPMSSGEVSMRTGGASINVRGAAGVATNQVLSGRPAHSDNSSYHPVYSHQSQLRREESQGKAS